MSGERLAVIIFVLVTSLVGLISFTGKRFEDIIINGDFNQNYHQNVNSETRVYFIFNFSVPFIENKNLAIRFKVAAVRFNSSRPLMMVVERYKSIFSWQIPLLIKNSLYFDFTRTLCPEWNDNSSSNFATFIFSTTSPSNLTFDFIAFIEDIGLISSRNVSVTPTSPVYFFYKIPQDMDSVIVKAESPNNSCAVLSIQNAHCPVYDMVGILEHSRFFATMTTKGAITVTKSSLETNSFFIILSMHPEDFDSCATLQDIIPENRESSVKSFFVKVNGSISYKKLLSAIVVGFICFLLIYVITFMSLIIYYYRFRSPQEIIEVSEHENDNETQTLMGGDPGVRQNYGTEVSTGNLSEEVAADDYHDYENVIPSSDYIWSKPHLCVADMMKEKSTLSKKQRTFFWDLVSLAIFYFLPVIQLVLNFQKTLNNTGDQDICYYNFYCIHQVGSITAFNSFFSNIGYVMLGILFLYLVYRRENSYMKLISLNVSTIKYGIPQRFDIFYAMGLALVMEGLLSACYHICPSYSNFQFDTSFMYMIGWLCMLKIYQNRHQDMSLRAHVAYSIIAFVVLSGVIGITEGSLMFWVCFMIIYLLFILYLSLQVYYLEHWRLDLGIFMRIFIRIKYEKSLMRPIYLDRLILLVIGNLANWSLAIYGVLKRPQNFATYLLYIMLANFMMYFLFYLIMKVKYREKIFFVSYLFLSMAVFFWTFSLYFFFNQSVIWELSPALSREHNKECLWMDFYDHHDIWHFLSALSIFFSFMVLLTLDDGLWNKPRDQIKVF